MRQSLVWWIEDGILKCQLDIIGKGCGRGFELEEKNSESVLSGKLEADKELILVGQLAR